MIEYSLITDEWRIGIRDGGDADRLPDIEPLSALATLTPVTAQLTTASDGIEPSWNLLLAPVTVTYENGKLVGTDSVEGVKVIAAINGRPVSWRVERTLTWENRRIPVPTIVIAPTPGGTFHLPDASPTSPDVDIRQAFITLGDIERTLAQTRAVNDEAVAGLERVNQTIETIDTAASETRELLGRAEAAAETAGGHATTATAAAEATALDAASVRGVVEDGAAALRGEIRTTLDDLSATTASASTSAEAAATSARNAQESETSAAASASAADTSRALTEQERALTVEEARTAASSIAQQVALDIRDGAPAHLDTLRELAEWASQNDDAMAALTAQIATKVTGDYPIVIRHGLPEESGPRNEITFWVGGDE